MNFDNPEIYPLIGYNWFCLVMIVIFLLLFALFLGNKVIKPNNKNKDYRRKI